MDNHIIAVTLILLILVIMLLNNEYMSMYKPYFDAFEQRHPNPDCHRFFGREKPNIFGYTQSDYFLRNQLEYEQRLGPQLTGWDAFQPRDKAYL